MNNLIIDAAKDKIFFTIIAGNKSYTSEFSNNRENFDKLTILIIKFLKNHRLNIKNLNNVFVNQGPGKFSGIRISISVAKALSLVNNTSLIGFNSKDINKGEYKNILELHKKGLLINNLIKPLYSS